MNIEQLYYKIKLLLLQYEEIKQLDEKYIEIFLYELGNNLQLNEPDFLNTSSSVFEMNNNIEERTVNKSKHGNFCIQMYRKLAKILHPDKSNIDTKQDKSDIDTKQDEFIKMSKAYETNDYITLFILSYENKVNINLSDNELELINTNIKNKEHEIETTQTKIHWKWFLAENEFEKQQIKESVINN